MPMSVEELRNVLRDSPYYDIVKENVETLDEELLGNFFCVMHLFSYTYNVCLTKGSIKTELLKAF